MYFKGTVFPSHLSITQFLEWEQLQSFPDTIIEVNFEVLSHMPTHSFEERWLVPKNTPEASSQKATIIPAVLG